MERARFTISEPLSAQPWSKLDAAIESLWGFFANCNQLQVATSWRLGPAKATPAQGTGRTKKSLFFLGLCWFDPGKYSGHSGRITEIHYSTPTRPRCSPIQTRL